ncbi:MAG: hypothetical protein HY560_01185, partial [Gemmatimonadetes bacterium]|nr:hypothetical protein [Gemmatimonadota bacterium]
MLLCAVIGCGGGQISGQGIDPAPEGPGIVVRGSELTGNLLDGLRVRVPTMSVAYPVGECPRIVFRGQRSLRNQGNPSVYVDGTLMGDTCGLTQILASDVDHVEIYPSGNTARA